MNEELKQRHATALHLAIDKTFGTEPSSDEPVAWMEADVLPLTHIIKAVVRREQDEQHTIPLYTHPAKTLTPLTDDEIEIECRKAWNLNDQYRLNLEEVIRFAHAILRKAQENELLKKLAVPDEARQKLHELQVKQCGDSYDTVCPPSVCDCRKAQEK